MCQFLAFMKEGWFELVHLDSFAELGTRNKALSGLQSKTLYLNWLIPPEFYFCIFKYDSVASVRMRVGSRKRPGRGVYDK